MCALGDPKYSRLTEVMTPDDSEGLLTFVNTSSKDETHTLTGDYTREQRTKVSRSIRTLTPSTTYVL